MKRALITGITGQDGSYLTELLVAKGYEVHGMVHDVELLDPSKIAHLAPARRLAPERVKIHFGDLSDGASVQRVFEEVEPDEVYNLGAQSHVGVSFGMPELTSNITALGTLRLLEAIRRTRPSCRFYQASSSEMFGKVAQTPQSESTPFHPRSPYAVAKVYSYWMAVNYREAYGMFTANGILFNHESERRGELFVTRKITRAIGRIVHGLQSELVLGNMDARRDWGHAMDYVEAMWRMLQHEAPGDWVVGTGETHSVRDFVEAAFGHAKLDWKDFVRTDEALHRPAEVDLLRADPSKAERELGWKAQIRFPELVARMVDHDIALAAEEKRRAAPK